MSSSITVKDLDGYKIQVCNLQTVLDENPNPFTIFTSSKARKLLNTLNEEVNATLKISVNELEITASVSAYGIECEAISASVTPAQLQRAFCAFLSEVFTCTY